MLTSIIVTIIYVSISIASPSIETRAIDLVKNHMPSAQITTIEPLTIGDLIELEVKSLTMQGLQARVVWGAVDNDNGWYVVAARFEYIDPFVGWEELYSVQWRVHTIRKEIVGLDNMTRIYL